MTSDVLAVRPGLPRPIRRDALVEAVAAHRSWRGVMRALGLTTSRTGRVLRSICDELEIDYSHFRQSRVDLRPLPEVVRDAETWEEVLGKLGYAPGSGSARATVRKHCRQLGLDTSHLVLAAAPAALDSLVPRPDRLRFAGPYLVAAAMTMAGCVVSWPTEGAVYDLVVELPTGSLQRVQVKTSTRADAETWQCKLTRTEEIGGVRRRSFYSREDIDAFACVDGDGAVYLIPIDVVEGVSSISLRKYQAFRLRGLCCDARVR